MPRLPSLPPPALSPETVRHLRERAQIFTEGRAALGRVVRDHFMEREQRAQRALAAQELAEQIEQAGNDWRSRVEGRRP